ncbi:efflux transporter outer membrane subunit [Silvimonas sp. JCM 19000]
MIPQAVETAAARWRSPALLTVLAASILAGCANMKGLDTSASLRDASSVVGKNATDASVWPAQDWWHSLNDAQLDALIADALKNNPNLEVADARNRAALAQAGAADAARAPRVDAAAAYSGIRIPGTVLPPPYGDSYAALKMVSLKFSYDFDLWGGERAAWEAAAGQARAAAVDAQQARITLSGNIARTYAQLGYAWSLQDVARAELKRSQDLLGLVKQRVDAGIDSQLQSKQAQAAVPAAQQQIEAAQQQIDDARLELAALVGASPDRADQLARPQLIEPSRLALPNTLPANLLGRRADVVAARWRVESASQDIKAAKAKFYPDFNLSAAVGLASLGLGDLPHWESRYAQLAPAITLPIFDGGRLRNNLAGKDAQYDVAVAQYNLTLVNAVHDVAAQISALKSLQKQVAQQQDSIRIAREAFDLAMQRYHGGLGNYVDALTVEQQLYAGEMRLAALNAQQIDASVLLVQALGGGFNADGALPGQVDASSVASAQ